MNVLICSMIFFLLSSSNSKPSCWRLPANCFCCSLFNLSSFITYGIPLKGKLKGSNFNFNNNKNKKGEIKPLSWAGFIWEQWRSDEPIGMSAAGLWPSSCSSWCVGDAPSSRMFRLIPAGRWILMPRSAGLLRRLPPLMRRFRMRPGISWWISRILPTTLFCP